MEKWLVQHQCNVAFESYLLRQSRPRQKKVTKLQTFYYARFSKKKKRRRGRVKGYKNMKHKLYALQPQKCIHCKSDMVCDDINYRFHGKVVSKKFDKADCKDGY